MDATLRPYDPVRDAAGVRACFVELHEHERRFEPGAPPAEAIADAYLEHVLARCASWDGQLFVADCDGALVGFVSVWARVPPQEPDDEPVEVAFVSDLVVLPAWRGRGIGRALLARAEAFARARGADRIGVGVLAENGGARRLYQALGYREAHIELRKTLA